MVYIKKVFEHLPLWWVGMDAYSYHYCQIHSPRFGRVGWSPRWSMWANDALTLWLRLYNLSKCISHPCYTNRRCLSTFHCGGWAYECTFTSLPPQNIAPDLGELNKVLSMCANYATMLSLWLYNLSNCIPHPCYTFRRYVRSFCCGRWAYGCTFTPLPPQM